MKLWDKPGQGSEHDDRRKAILTLLSKLQLSYHLERRWRNGALVDEVVTDATVPLEAYSTPTEWRYRVLIDETRAPRLLTPEFAKQLEAALNATSVRVTQEGSTIWIALPKPRDALRDVPWREAWALGPGVGPGCLLLGINEAGGQLSLDMGRAENWGAIVVGMSGSGKTTLLQTMALSAVSSGQSVLLCDPEYSPQRALESLWPLSGHPRVWGHGLYADPDGIAWALAQAIGAAWRGLGGDLYLFVDEVPQLIRDARIRDALTVIARQGRKRGLHLIMGAQHIVAEDVPGATARNAPVRLVGRMSDRTAAYLATGQAESGAERLQGRGDMLAVTGGGLVRFKSAYVPEEDWQQLMALYRPRLAHPPTPSASVSAPVTVPVGIGGGHPGGGGGSDPHPTPQAWIDAIRAYRAEHGEWPVPYWVRQAYHVGAARAERILREAGA